MPGCARRAREPSIRDAARRFNTGKSEIGRYLKALKENGSPAVSPCVGGRPCTLRLDEEAALEAYTY